MKQFRITAELSFVVDESDSFELSEINKSQMNDLLRGCIKHHLGIEASVNELDITQIRISKDKIE